MRNKLALFIICFFISACSLKPKENLAGKFGGTLRLAHRGQDPKTFNPWIASDASSASFGGLLFEALIRFDPDTDEPLPHLAKSFELQDSGRTILVTLRDNIFWTDGKAISAEDVTYTWNTLIRDEVATSSLKDILEVNGHFPLVEALDDKTIRFQTQKVFAPFLRTLSTEIAPKHDIESYFEEQEAKSFEEKQKAFNNYLNIHTEPSEIVSSGAFKLKKIKNGERIEFVRNPKFFLKDKLDETYPYADKVLFTYAQDASAEMFKFFAKEAYHLNVSPQNAALVKGLESKYNFHLFDLGPSGGTNFIWFNLSKNVHEPQYSWFNNKLFRQAVSYAINRESVVNNVFQGLAAPLYTAESLKSPFLNEKLATGYKRDIEKSKELLKQAGFEFKTVNDELRLYDANGHRVEFSLFTNAGNQEREFMSIIAIDNLKEVGIKVNFKLLEFNNFVGRIMQGKDYQAGIISLTGGNEPNNGANVWKSDGRLHMFDIKKFQDNPITRPWEKEIDSLFASAVETMDFAERKKYYDRFQEIVYEECPMIYIASPKVLSAIRLNLGNVRLTKYGGAMPHLYEVYLKS